MSKYNMSSTTKVDNNAPLRVKFVEQNKPQYEKEINHIDDMNDSEKREFLAIFVRIKKKISFIRKILGVSNDKHIKTNKY